MSASPLGFRLLAITPPAGTVPAGIVEQWLNAGVQPHEIAVLLREPNQDAVVTLAPDGRLAGLRRACDRFGIAVLLSCRPSEVVRACQAVDALGLTGIQLAGDPQVALLTRARALLADARLGRSVHGCQPQPGHGLVDYSVLAPVFAPNTVQRGVDKDPIGMAALSAWASRPGDRVFALGGITPERALACVEVGAFGIATISGFFGEPARVAQDVGRLRAALSAHAPSDVSTARS